MILENALAFYYPKVQHGLRELLKKHDGDEGGFSPGPDLPELDDNVRGYLAPSDLSFEHMAEYRGHHLSLLDLTRNAGTRTTKTFASLLIVARAVRHIERSGERITILTPSSANKAIALRHAVERAIEYKLAAPSQLNVVTVVPAVSAYKLRSSALSRDSELVARNPVAIYRGVDPEGVKTIGREVLRHRRPIEEATGSRLWYTLQLENYLAADIIRAFAESDFFPGTPGRPRLHAHAVSSAYGLLGHAYGRTLLGARTADWPCHYLLVQHLGAPDMVTDLYRGQPDGFDAAPAYVYDTNSGCYLQYINPHFPRATFDPAEVLDPTFYSRMPLTAPRMTALIRSSGGGGIVVSLAECLERFGLARSFLEQAGMKVPANPTMIQEWSIIMAITGVLNAIDRGIIREEDILVHGSGLYARSGFDPLETEATHAVDDAESLVNLILRTTSA